MLKNIKSKDNIKALTVKIDSFFNTSTVKLRYGNLLRACSIANSEMSIPIAVYPYRFKEFVRNP